MIRSQFILAYHATQVFRLLQQEFIWPLITFFSYYYSVDSAVGNDVKKKFDEIEEIIFNKKTT